MTTLLARGMDFLNRNSKVSAAETVRYLRESSVCEGLLAVPMLTDVEQLTEGEATVVGKRCDWGFEPNDLVIDGLVIEPQEGDRIEWDRPGVTLVYEVLPADGEKVLTPMGQFQNRIRVHTKLIESRSSE